MLLIDIGNSRIKAGIEHRDSIRALPAVEWRNVAPADAFNKIFAALMPPTRVAVSNVAGNAIATALSDWLQEKWQIKPEFVTVMTSFAGMHTRYERPAQLGIDRWLAALAGFKRAQGAACVIDAGTALTVDVVTADGQHLGGLIAPGLSLMARSLTHGTAQLSLDKVESVERFATNTAAAISLGCREAIAGIIERVSARWRHEIGGQPSWYATGGEASIVCEVCPFAIEAIPDLVLQGLAIAARR